MAYENVRWTVPGVTSSGDLSAEQNKFVIVDGNGQIAVNTASDAPSMGVLQNDPSAQGRASTVAVAPSTVKVLVAAGVTFNEGDEVACEDAGGQEGEAKVAIVSEFIVGFALEAGTAGEIITVQLSPQGIKA